ncbi:anthrone oxygenase family protein [Arthrobacter sp. SAFR-179]|uniref:anthrone oxygenase family protein n=1 Tax=Arthrobacter sp. SAFR-179 TaxID=3387279 RepID=UPI003F7C5994
MGQTSSPRRDLLTDRLLDAAEFSHAHWFFGNLYELLVKMPHRVAASEASKELPRSPFGAGSPGRYYAPLAPINAPAAVGALAAGWHDQTTRTWLMVAAASSVIGAAATVYVLRSLNPKLFFSREPLAEDQREPLLRRWYNVHAVRLAASAVALTALHRARTIRLKSR